MNPNIQAKIADWRKQLLDLSKRNRLINCKVGARGAIEIEYPALTKVWQRLVLDSKTMTFVWRRDLLGEQPNQQQLPGLLLEEELNGESEQSKAPQSELQQCLESPKLREEHLLTQLTDRPLGTRLNRLSLNARTSLTEQGINTLYLAFGLLKWYESIDSNVALLSPLLLVPVKLIRRGPDAPWNMSLYEEELVPNRCLQEMLHSNFKIELPSIPEDDIEAIGDPASFFKQVRSKIRANQRWEVLDKIVLGSFSFQKIAMWEDLGQNEEFIAGHDICRAIGGDEGVALSDGTDLPTGSELDDRIHPRQVHTILDCDSSQLEAIVAVKNGINLVVDGPPGTGKSQTIANIVAECLADKKTVLFVSEKAAALEVVKRRLDSRHLGDFCLECHSHKANKKNVIAELGRCMAIQPEEYRDQKADLDRLHTIRTQLNAYVRALHKPVGALDATPYTIHGQLAELKPARVSRCPIPRVLSTDAATLREITELLRSITRCGAVLEDFQHHPWRECRVKAFSLAVQDDIHYGFELLARSIDQLAEPSSVLVQHCVLQENATKSQLEESVGRIEDILKHPILPAQWFSGEPRKVATTFITLDSLSKQFREQVVAMPQLQLSSLDGTAAERITAVLGSSNGWVTAANLPEVGSIRSRQSHLLRLVAGAEVMANRAADVAHAVEHFVSALQVPIAGNPNLNLLAKLAALGKIIAKTGPLKPSWFDDDVRNRLRQTMSAVQVKQGTAQALRFGLAARLAATAFDNLPDPLIEDGNRLQDLRKSVKSKERSFRRRAAGLYADDAHKPWGRIVEDLNVFHRLQGRFTAAQQDLAAKFNPTAFTVAGAGVANDCQRFHSPWYRLFGLAIDLINAVAVRFDPRWSVLGGGWEGFKSSASALYNGARPERSPELLEDLALLRDFHLRVASLYQELPATMKPCFAGVDVKGPMRKAAHLRRQVKRYAVQRSAFSQRVERFYIGASPDDPAVIMQDLSKLREYFGQTERNELARAVAGELGFQRLGKKIQGRIERAVTDLLRRKLVIKSESGLISEANGVK